jgi:hypothetical protein
LGNIDAHLLKSLKGLTLLTAFPSVLPDVSKPMPSVDHWLFIVFNAYKFQKRALY